MVRAVVALSAADLLSDASAGGPSLGAVDDITLSDGAAAVVLEEVLGAHSGGGRRLEKGPETGGVEEDSRREEHLESAGARVDRK